MNLKTCQERKPASTSELSSKVQFWDSLSTMLIDDPLKEEYEAEPTDWKPLSSTWIKIPLPGNVFECPKREDHRISTLEVDDRLASYPNNCQSISTCQTNTLVMNGTETHACVIHNLVKKTFKNVNKNAFDSDKMPEVASSSTIDAVKDETCEISGTRDFIIKLNRIEPDAIANSKQSITADRVTEQNFIETHSVDGLQKVKNNGARRSHNLVKIISSRIRDIECSRKETAIGTCVGRVTDFRNVLPVKRKRGRPRKDEIEHRENISTNQISFNKCDVLSVKRKKERPRKNDIKYKENIITDTFNFNKCVVRPVKRKRGRPRKDDVRYKENINTNQLNFNVPSVKKKRGRPRKNDMGFKENIITNQYSPNKCSVDEPHRNKQRRSHANAFKIKNVNRVEDTRRSSPIKENPFKTSNNLYEKIVMTRSKTAICGNAHEFVSLSTGQQNSNESTVETKTDRVDCAVTESPSGSLREEKNLSTSPTSEKEKPTQCALIARTPVIRLIRCEIPIHTCKITNRETDREFYGFNDSEIENSTRKFEHYSGLLESGATRPIKTRRKMTKQRMVEKTQQYFKNKQSFLNHSNGLRASKLMAARKIKLWIKPSPIPKYLRGSTRCRTKSPKLFDESFTSAHTPNPYVKLTKLNVKDISSYAITPLKEDRIPIAPKTAEDYGISDVTTDASTDDEEYPKKRIPDWCRDAKSGCSRAFKIQSAVSRSLVSLWMHASKREHSLRQEFFM